MTDHDLSAPKLMAEVTQRTGLADWGEDDGFTQPLSLLVESCLATDRLSDTGRRVLRSVLLRHLRNRLYLQVHLAQHPGAADTWLETPVVITGMPRTGTSLLHGLLAQDPRHRFLPLWQALHPVPVQRGDGPDEATLVHQAETWLERFYAAAPGFRAVHPLTPTGPEECDALLQNAFASQHFDDMFDAEAYSRWFYGADLHREYAYYALQLRVLSSGPERSRRWVLKSPGHLAHLDALAHVLPGARIVHCHRDPAQAVPSYASLIRTVRAPNAREISMERVGEQALTRAAASVARALRVRAQAEDGDFFDVSFAALVADPVAVAARIYEWLGTSLDATAESSMRRWLAVNPRDRQGSHEYDPLDFGLEPPRTRERFGDYLTRFGDYCGDSVFS